ncbi:hypothetical protein AB3R30_26310 [Leptolyngbyaceae cyanobacterium UHCC 1019]
MTRSFITLITVLGFAIVLGACEPTTTPVAPTPDTTTSPVPTTDPTSTPSPIPTTSP